MDITTWEVAMTIVTDIAMITITTTTMIMTTGMEMVIEGTSISMLPIFM